MRRAEGVVLALRAFGKSRQAAALPQGADAVAAAGEDFVRICLMPHIPDQAVPRGIEHMVQRDRQLDHAEACPQVPAGSRNRADGLGSQLICELPQRRLG